METKEVQWFQVKLAGDLKHQYKIKFLVKMDFSQWRFCGITLSLIRGGGRRVRQDRETAIQKEGWVDRAREGDEGGNEGNDGMSKGNLGLRALLRVNTSKLFRACKQWSQERKRTQLRSTPRWN